MYSHIVHFVGYCIKNIIFIIYFVVTLHFTPTQPPLDILKGLLFKFYSYECYKFV